MIARKDTGCLCEQSVVALTNNKSNEQIKIPQLEADIPIPH